MAVLIEGLSVVVRREAMVHRFDGGPQGFLRLVPNRTLCADGTLVRVGFMTPPDADAFVSMLERRGLVFMRDGQAVDLTAVDQHAGATRPAPWLAFGQRPHDDHLVSAAWVAGQDPGPVAVPNGWDYGRSLSRESGFVSNEEFAEHFTFVRHEGGCDVYVDRRTGKEMFLGRPTIEGDTEAALQTQLRSLFHRARAIEHREVEGPGVGAEALSELHELLGEAESIVRGPGQEIGSAYYVRGLILRIKGDFAAASDSLRTANELHPGHLSTLLELVLCLGTIGRHREALPFAREGVHAAPDDAGAWGNLAITLLHCGEMEEGRRAIEYALKLDPSDAINQNVLREFQT